jgi:hypothetical protein
MKIRSGKTARSWRVLCLVILLTELGACGGETGGGQTDRAESQPQSAEKPMPNLEVSLTEAEFTKAGSDEPLVDAAGR